jgi:hypothetical protein
VGENSLDLNAQKTLAVANDSIRRNQEDRWIGYEPQPPSQLTKANLPSWQIVFLDSNVKKQLRPHPSRLRDSVRQYQQIAAYYALVQIEPDNDQYHKAIAHFYLEQNLLDLALDHMQIAETAFQARRTVIPTEYLKAFDQEVKDYRNLVESLEKNVKQRLAKWKENHVKADFQSAVAAWRGHYTDLSLGPNAQTPLALGKKALEVIGNLKEEVKNNERVPLQLFRYELLLSMGRADVVAAELAREDVKKAIPHEYYSEFQLLAAGASGDYHSMDVALTSIAKSLREVEPRAADEIKKRAGDAAASYFMAGTGQTIADLACSVMHTTLTRNVVALARDNHNGVRAEFLSVLTLHGIILLEAGDTARARGYFHQAVNDWNGEVLFGDRPIALRYLALLDEQHARQR